MRLRIWIAGVVACLMLGAVATACGGGGSTSNEATGQTDSEPAESEPTAEGGGEGSWNVKPRTIGLVLTAGESPISTANTATLEKIADDFGWTLEQVDAQGDPAQMLRATEVFATKGVDAVLFDSVQAEWVQPGLRRLQGLGIPAIGFSAGNPVSPLFDAQYMEDEKKVGVEMGNLLVSEIPEAKIGEIQSSFAAGLLRAEGLREVLDGPDGDGGEILASVEPNLVNVVPETTKGVTDMLTAEPDINSIFSVYDNYIQPTIAALRSKGSDAVIIAPYLTPGNFEEMEKDASPLVGVLNVDNPTTAAVAVGQLLGFFEEGAEIDPNALDQHPLKYEGFTRENLPASWEEVLGPEAILEPFLPEWEEKYGG